MNHLKYYILVICIAIASSSYASDCVSDALLNRVKAEATDSTKSSAHRTRWEAVANLLERKASSLTRQDIYDIYERRKRNRLPVSQWKDVVTALKCLDNEDALPADEEQEPEQPVNDPIPAGTSQDTNSPIPSYRPPDPPRYEPSRDINKPDRMIHAGGDFGYHGWTPPAEVRGTNVPQSCTDKAMAVRQDFHEQNWNTAVFKKYGFTPMRGSPGNRAAFWYGSHVTSNGPKQYQWQCVVKATNQIVAYGPTNGGTPICGTNQHSACTSVQFGTINPNAPCRMVKQDVTPIPLNTYHHETIVSGPLGEKPGEWEWEIRPPFDPYVDHAFTTDYPKWWRNNYKSVHGGETITIYYYSATWQNPHNELDCGNDQRLRYHYGGKNTPDYWTVEDIPKHVPIAPVQWVYAFFPDRMMRIYSDVKCDQEPNHASCTQYKSDNMRRLFYVYDDNTCAAWLEDVKYHGPITLGDLETDEHLHKCWRYVDDINRVPGAVASDPSKFEYIFTPDKTVHGIGTGNSSLVCTVLLLTAHSVTNPKLLHATNLALAQMGKRSNGNAYEGLEQCWHWYWSPD